MLLATIGAAVLCLHAALLLALGPAWFDPDEANAPTAAVMRVRSVVLAPVVVPTTSPIEMAVPAPAAAKPAQRVSQQAALPAAPPRDVVAASPDATRAQEADAEPTAAAEIELIEVPVYATRLPPSGVWRYRMQRGLAGGEAELRWAVGADARYELQLEGRVAGVALLDWVSAGQLDTVGIAPGRFAVRRRGRDRQAANFQREAAKISFSGPTHELPLVPGAQDRLSWMVQLPAIVAAAPERFISGVPVRLFVAGARGGADVWTFVVQGLDSQSDTSALKLVREPRRVYDTRVEIWLDPAAHYMPLRVLQTPSGGGPALELVREP